MNKLSRLAMFVCSLLVAAVFVYVGASKLGGASSVGWAERFARWGYPANAHYLVGLLQIVGGIGVLVPKWRRAAAALLIVLMIGAFFTHIIHSEFSRVIPPLVLGALALVLYSLRARPA